MERGIWLVRCVVHFLLFVWIMLHLLKREFIRRLNMGGIAEGSDGLFNLTGQYTVTELDTVELPIPTALTCLRTSNSKLTIHGYPLHITISSTRSDAQCYVLKDVSIEEFHKELGHDHQSLLDYVRAKRILHFSIVAGVQELNLKTAVPRLLMSMDKHKRITYGMVIALFAEASDNINEQIVASFYVIHVRLRECEETVPTKVLYTFWKTNWNRLLVPQLLFAATDNSPNMDDNRSGQLNDVGDVCWKPSCFICLNEVTDILHVMLPCRHAGLCLGCQKEFCTRRHSSNVLDNLLTCPLCRTPVNTVLKLPPVSGY